MRREQLKIRVKQIPEEGKAFTFKVDTKKANQYFALLKTSDFSALSDLEGDVHVSNLEGMVVVEGDVGVSLKLTCSRCLSSFPYQIFNHFRSVYAPFSETCQEEDVKLKPYDMDVSIYNGVDLDLDNVLFEQVFLGMPAQELCRPDCKGLCPACGVNLNYETCKCGVSVPQTPFTILKKLKLKG